MKKHQHEQIDTVFKSVIPYIHDGDDRNSISFVCRKWYELHCMTRKHVTVHVFYSPRPSRVAQRFPHLKSLTLKGLPNLKRFAESRGKDLRVLKINKCKGFNANEFIHIGGLELECLHVQVQLQDNTNEAMECIGAHLKKLRDVRITLSMSKTRLMVDSGIEAMLIGFRKLE
ncbi:hypothetical protein CTI12_AA006260 [Artemisia annua]|uniref:COI1 F-box domain-containing protein n=1 Tax=Artemisia annua TaxID=35608 RepID=A0A2U1QNI0_ARTAN|nr:hypothetical protein CTI12_AA006260 [Artemisia annua]